MDNNSAIDTCSLDIPDRTNLKLLKQAVESSISGVVITNYRLPDNPIIYCNKAFEQITGYSKNEILGKNCRFLQGLETEQESRFIVQDAIENGQDVVVEFRNYRKNKDLFWNELYLSPIKDEAGKITHFIGVQNDITRRKKAEQDLKEKVKLVSKMKSEIELS